MSLQNELLFDLVESYADVNIFLDRPQDNFKAEKAGIIITSNAVGHFPKKAGDKYTVWFGRGVVRYTYRTFKEAVKQVADLLKKAEVEMNYRFEGKEVKKFNRIFAEVLGDSGS